MKPSLAWTFLIVALVLNASANILLKVGAMQSRELASDASLMTKALNFLNIATCMGIVLFAGNVLVYRKALTGLPISIAYPVMVSVGLLIIVVAARFIPLLGEKISLTQGAGMALIIAGVWLVSRTPTN